MPGPVGQGKGRPPAEEFSMMTRKEMKQELFAMMEQLERFHKQDVLNNYNPQSVGEEREVLLALNGAMHQIRELKGIDFGPVSGHPGTYGRKDSDQTLKRGRRDRAQQVRKGQRALVKFQIAADKTKDPVEKEKIEREADRQRLRIALNRRSSQGLKDLIGWE
jgi:hypothetical protein